jgi:hypothetical protein
MQVNGEQLDEFEPARIHTPLREASALHDAAAPETRKVHAPGEESRSEAPSVKREADYTAVIEALVIAALHALEAHVWDVKKRIAILQERGDEVAESPTVTSRH